MKQNLNIENLNKNPTEWGLDVSLELLFETITKASDAYYNTTNAIINDDVFDKLVDIYNMRSPVKYSNIGSSIKESNKCKLPYHMGSMNKTKSISVFLKWLAKQQVNHQNFVITPKIDGTSALVILSLEDDTIKTEIFTRGDGDVGKQLDFLNEVLVSKDVKLQVKEYMIKMSINRVVMRGEMIVSKANFEPFSDKFKCPRSMVNGLTNKKDHIDAHALEKLDFVLFEIIESKLSVSDQFKLAKQLKLNCVDWKEYNFSELHKNLEGAKEEDILSTIPGKILTDYRKSYKYDIDGIIISNDISYNIPTEGNPEYSIAFKINQDGVVTKVNEVQWNVSKHGVLKPKLIFDQIKLGSSKVERCTGFNGAYIFNNCIGPGAVIRVVLSGEIIPYVTEIISQSKMPSMPKVGYKWNDTKVDCLILEDNDNLQKKKIVTFVKTVEIDYLAEGLISHLFKNGFKTLKEILTIKKDELLKLERIDEKMASKLIESIQRKINVPLELEKLMDGSLCFGNGFGIKRCAQIVINFPNFLEFTPSEEELSVLPGWSSKSIYKFFEGLPKFKKFIEENDYLKFKTNKEETKSSISLKKVCITGKRNKEIIEFLQKQGVELVSSITNSVDLLICEYANSSSGKLLSAKKKGIDIKTVDEFKKAFME